MRGDEAIRWWHSEPLTMNGAPFARCRARSMGTVLRCLRGCKTQRVPVIAIAMHGALFHDRERSGEIIGGWIRHRAVLIELSTAVN